MNVIGIRRACGIVYEMHVRNMGTDDRQRFDFELNDDFAGTRARAASIRARSASFGMSPVVINGVS